MPWLQSLSFPVAFFPRSSRHKRCRDKKKQLVAASVKKKTTLPSPAANQMMTMSPSERQPTCVLRVKNSGACWPCTRKQTRGPLLCHKGHSQSEGSSSSVSLPISGGETHVCQPSEREPKNCSPSAHMSSWFTVSRRMFCSKNLHERYTSPKSCNWCAAKKPHTSPQRLEVGSSRPPFHQ